MSEKQRLDIVFMGTPDFAAVILRALHRWEGCRVSAVYCQPDRPAGRGNKLQAPAVKLAAQELGLPVLQPLHFKEDATVAELAAFKPDFLVVAAYGLILPQRVLDIPRCAPLNVHGSLLPRYRGAAPIQRAIMDGLDETGVSIMRMEAGLDTGPVYKMCAMPVDEHTAGSLHDALAGLGATCLLDVLADFAAYTPVPQDDAAATYAPKMTKHDGFVDWEKTAAAVHAQIRAVTPWPAAKARIFSAQKGTTPVTLGVGRVGSMKPLGLPCGEVWCLDNGEVAVTCEDRYYILESVRPESRKSMPALSFANGYLDARHGYAGRCLKAADDPARPSDNPREPA